MYISREKEMQVVLVRASFFSSTVLRPPIWEVFDQDYLLTCAGSRDFKIKI